MARREKLPLSYEFHEQLAQWMRQCCPCAMDDPDRVFYLGVVAICETEVKRGLAKERGPVLRSPGVAAPAIVPRKPDRDGRRRLLALSLRSFLYAAKTDSFSSAADDQRLNKDAVPLTLTWDLIKFIEDEVAAAVKARLDGQEGGDA